MIINAITKKVSFESFSEDELKRIQQEKSAKEERELLESLVPSDEEISQADFELKTITFLMEVGLL